MLENRVCPRSTERTRCQNQNLANATERTTFAKGEPVKKCFKWIPLTFRKRKCVSSRGWNATSSFFGKAIVGSVRIAANVYVDIGA